MGLVSLSLCAYQVMQTRLLSALFVYHYVFLVASVAVLGLALGASVVLGWARLREAFARRPSQVASWLGLAIGVAFLIGFAVVSGLPFLGSAWIYAGILLPPTIVGGMALALAFQHANHDIGGLYGADLIGAGLGSVGVVLALDGLGLLRTWIAIAMCPLLASMSLTSRGHIGKGFWLALVAILGLGSQLASGGALSRLEREYPPVLSAPSKFVASMNSERGGERLRIVHTRWDSLARTDVIEIAGEPDRKAITMDGVAYAGMHRFDGDIDSIARYPETSGYLPSIGHLSFAGLNCQEALLIGTGGGRDVLYALKAGCKHIDAVEINRASIEAARKYSDFAGSLYDRPDVDVHVEDGRNFLRTTRKHYDIIFLALVKTEAAAAVGMGMVENFIFTEEAVAEYLEHLSDQGRVAFIVHHEAALAKVVATAMRALKGRGVADIELPSHLAVFGSKALDPVASVFEPLVAVKRRPFERAEALALAKASDQTGNPAAYIPFFAELGRLGEVRAATRSPADFTADLEYNAAPATDDCPYFYRFDTTVPTSVTGALVLALVLGLGLTLRPVIRHHCIKDAAYFAVLGVGFMLVEIPLAQKMALHLGSTTRAFALVLCGLLTGAGLGSYAASTKRPRFFSGARLWSALFVALAVLLVVGLLDWLLPLAAQLSFAAEAALCVLLVASLGFFMGMPFPLGIRSAQTSDRSALVPLYLTINAAASVVGSVLAVAVSLYAGYYWVTVLGAACYALLFVSSGVYRSG